MRFISANAKIRLGKIHFHSLFLISSLHIIQVISSNITELQFVVLFSIFGNLSMERGVLSTPLNQCSAPPLDIESGSRV